MSSTVARRARLGACATAFLLLLSAGACGGDDDPTVTSDSSATSVPTTVAVGGPTTTAPPGTVLAVTVRGGSVVEGSARQRATLGLPVTIRVTSDVADEVHVHGYEKKFTVAAGGTGEATFLANTPGVFEVEFEKSRKLLFTVEVR